MSGRTPDDAIETYLARVRECALCITDRPVLATGRRRSDAQRTVYLAPQGEPARLRGHANNRIVLFTFAQTCHILPPSEIGLVHSVQLASYEYRILDIDESEIVAFHWHPVGISRVREPHLHLSSRLNPVPLGRGSDVAPLSAMHVPTGFVPFADVARFLVDEFGIVPRRDDWSNVLTVRRDLSDFPAT